MNIRFYPGNLYSGLSQKNSNNILPKPNEYKSGVLCQHSNLITSGLNYIPFRGMTNSDLDKMEQVLKQLDKRVLKKYIKILIPSQQKAVIDRFGLYETQSALSSKTSDIKSSSRSMNLNYALQNLKELFEIPEQFRILVKDKNSLKILKSLNPELKETDRVTLFSYIKSLPEEEKLTLAYRLGLKNGKPLTYDEISTLTKIKKILLPIYLDKAIKNLKKLIINSGDISCLKEIEEKKVIPPKHCIKVPALEKSIPQINEINNKPICDINSRLLTLKSNFKNINKEILEKYFAIIPPVQQSIIKLQFGLIDKCYSKEEISKILSISNYSLTVNARYAVETLENLTQIPTEFIDMVKNKDCLKILSCLNPELAEIDKKTLFNLIEKLPEKEKRIMELKFGLNGEKALLNIEIGKLTQLAPVKINSSVESAIEIIKNKLEPHDYLLDKLIDTNKIDKIEKKLLKISVESEIDNLNYKEQSILRSRYTNQGIVPFSELSSQLNMHENTIRLIHNDALKKLKERLSPEIEHLKQD